MEIGQRRTCQTPQSSRFVASKSLQVAVLLPFSPSPLPLLLLLLLLLFLLHLLLLVLIVLLLLFLFLIPLHFSSTPLSYRRLSFLVRVFTRRSLSPPTLSIQPSADESLASDAESLEST